MRGMWNYINRRLSLRLGLDIIFVVAVIFVLAMSYLFLRSKDYLRQSAVNRASQILDNTGHRITDIMGEVETVADNMAWYVDGCMDPDSLIRDTREILLNNPHFHSCSISMEPNYFKQYGRYFSIYSVRDADTISTAQYGSDDFQYFNQEWYSKPQGLLQGCWIEPYLNTNPQATYKTDVITTYSRPLLDSNGYFIGVIAIDLNLKWLSQEITSVEPYPNSSSIIIGSKGQYLVHPDTLKLIHESIFSDPAPESKTIVDSLGQKMIAGESGMLSCYQTISGAIAPLQLLAHQAHDIAEGHYSNRLPKTSRYDTIGQLQNSFADMQASLSDYVDNIGLINTQMEDRNCELAAANEKALEADRKKTAFLQDMMHQIRTPLNIICGFAQVLNDSFHELPPDESRNITQMMQDNARKMTHITRLLLGFASPTSHIVLKKETFSCNEACREVVDNCRLTNSSTVKLHFETMLSDDYTLHTDKQRVQLILEELLDNANKFTQQGTITVSCGQKDQQTVTIRVSDTGIGIAKTDRKNIFTQFVKIDLFTEGVGLGLPLSKRAAQRIGGDLVLDEAYDQGAAFVLTIPINI